MTTNLQIPKENGRVILLNGRIFFSPNCSRSVNLPEVRTQNPYCSYNARGQNNLWNLEIAAFRQPRWWSGPFGNLSFFPLTPTFTTPVFEALIYSTIKPEYHHNFGYSMQKADLDHWLALDQKLYQTVMLLQAHYDISLALPASPWAFGYYRSHSNLASYRVAVRKSREWFVVWMGLVSYVIAQAEYITQCLRDNPNARKLPWRQVVPVYGAEFGLDEIWVDALSQSTISLFSYSNERAGIFLRYPCEDKTQPNIHWFLAYCIPVWYEWSSIHAQNPSIAHLAPLSHQLQTGIPSKPSRPINTGSLEQPWDTFFSVRHQLHLGLMIKETPDEQQDRSARMKDSSLRVNPKVFVWMRDISGIYIRSDITNQVPEGPDQIFEDAQIVYDPFYNEYDCCEDWTSFSGNKSDTDEFIPDSRTQDEVSALALQANHRLNVGFGSPEQELEGTKIYSETNVLDERLLSEILDTLRMYFGYTPIIPIPKTTPIHSQQLQKAFLRSIGVQWSQTQGAEDDFFALPAVSAAVDFFSRLARNQGILDDEWDLKRDNRESIHLRARFNSISMATTVDGTSLFIFQFVGNRPVKWKLGMKHAADALLVCRLDEEYDEIEIAKFLLTNGISFHTLQNSATLSRAPILAHDSLTTPFRPQNHQFSARDYRAYQNRCSTLLQHPRGRAALMRGHYMWRLAMNIVSWEWVFNGPTGLSTNPLEMTIIRIPGTVEGTIDEYVDDNLTEEEMLVLCGRYNCHTSRTDQFALKSWYMPPNKFESSAQDFGRWTAIIEPDFLLLENTWTRNLDAVAIKRGPHPMTRWSQFSRSSNDLHKARRRIEETALKVIKSAIA